MSKERNNVTHIHPSREHILGAGIMFLICLMFTGYNVKLFFWIPLLPLLFMAWTLYVRTTVTEQGLQARYMFRKNQSVDWEQFRGIRFPKNGRGHAVRADESTFWLPGVSFNSLVQLSQASNGRIPDPVTPGRGATHEKVQVVHKDGYAVLMDKDEYAEYEATRRAEYEATQQAKHTKQQVDHPPAEHN